MPIRVHFRPDLTKGDLYEEGLFLEKVTIKQVDDLGLYLVSDSDINPLLKSMLEDEGEILLWCVYKTDRVVIRRFFSVPKWYIGILPTPRFSNKKEVLTKK